MHRTLALLSLVVAASFGCGGGGAANLTPGPMPEGASFTGVWHSPQYGEMHMVQTGDSVVGEYTKDERRGRIQGHATGDLMRFEWSEERSLVAGRPSVTRGRGYFRFMLDENGKQTLLGEWGLDSADSGGGAWNAYKLARREPHLSGDADESGGQSDDWDDTDENFGSGGGSGSGSGDDEF